MQFSWCVKSFAEITFEYKKAVCLIADSLFFEIVKILPIS